MGTSSSSPPRRSRASYLFNIFKRISCYNVLLGNEERQQLLENDHLCLLVKGHILSQKSIEVLLPAFLNFACAFYIFLNLLDNLLPISQTKIVKASFPSNCYFSRQYFLISHEKILVDRKNCFLLSDVTTPQPFLPLASKL